jgi:hypothetical protein
MHPGRIDREFTFANNVVTSQTTYIVWLCTLLGYTAMTS